MKAHEVKKILNITQPTLSKYVKDNRIRVVKINKYHYIYNDDDIYKMIGIKKEKKQKINVSYSRISNKRNEDLKEQSQRIYNYCVNKGISIDIQYEDTKSGMNFDRIQFNQLIESVIKGEIELLIIENKDRLVRFGFELLENIFKYFGTKILVINDKLLDKTQEQELTDDLLSIIHYFSMKSYSNRRKLNKMKKELLSK